MSMHLPDGPSIIEITQAAADHLRKERTNILNTLSANEESPGYGSPGRGVPAWSGLFGRLAELINAVAKLLSIFSGWRKG